MVARLRHRLRRLSVPPNSVVKCVESISTMSPARSPPGGIQISALNSVLPAAVKGCGRSGSTGWRRQHAQARRSRARSVRSAEGADGNSASVRRRADPGRRGRGSRSAARSPSCRRPTAGRSPQMLWTGTSSACISERVYWLKRCWRGTSRSPWCSYSICRWAKIVGESDIVVRREQQAGAFAAQPLADRLDLAAVDLQARR